MQGIYLGSYTARHPNYNIIYNDIDEKVKPDLCCDMLEVDLSQYDFIIATPPCNWWSKANPYRHESEYALKTRHLLPLTIIKLAKLNKPFIIENVKNQKRYSENGIFKIIEKYSLFYQYVGRHIYITNINCDLECEQIQDFKHHGIILNSKNREGGENVHRVIEKWLKIIYKEN